MARVAKLRYTKNAFLTTSIMIVVLFCIPRLGSGGSAWLNPLYEYFCLFIMFPLIVWLGAGGKVNGKKATLFCKFLGDISYPIYITHFPIVYVYMAWVKNNGYTLQEAWPIGLLAAVVSIILAYLLMKFYDLPVREWLRKKFL